MTAQGLVRFDMMFAEPVLVYLRAHGPDLVQRTLQHGLLPRYSSVTG